MKRVVVLFVDAFSYSYINEHNTPFLAQQHVRKLTPSFGFKELASAFGCPDPLKSGLLTEHYFDSKHSPYKKTRLFPRPLLFLMNRFPPIARVLLFKYILRQKTDMPKTLPLDTAVYFSKDKNGYPQDAPLLLILESMQLSSKFILYPEVKTNSEAFQTLISEIKNGYQFLLVHFPSLDGVGHIDGIYSEAVRKLVIEMDQIISSIFYMFGRDSSILVFSDHGMVEVIGTINLVDSLKKIARPGKDYISFVNSTLAQIWILHEPSRHALEEKLSSLSNGKLILQSDIMLRDRLGDLIFVADPGYLIFPNYYDPNIVKGMHGYDIPSQTESTLNGICITKGIPNLILNEHLTMSDMFPIFKTALLQLNQ